MLAIKGHLWEDRGRRRAQKGIGQGIVVEAASNHPAVRNQRFGCFIPTEGIRGEDAGDLQNAEYRLGSGASNVANCRAEKAHRGGINLCSRRSCASWGIAYLGTRSGAASLV